ncbi:type II toxin-antitoxin system RelE family toxin [Helicobacter saguini]|uniref:type II toxin-antitoxin system RelE family toxin n=1 Tax=Helicobacter saguini TaxID=1548018 RepID=UPI000AB5A986|nr:hypothetical protein [Helicobacter saguini]
MAYEILFDKDAQKQFKKLDSNTQKSIKSFILELEKLENPRSKGKALVNNLSGFAI